METEQNKEAERIPPPSNPWKELAKEGKEAWNSWVTKIEMLPENRRPVPVFVNEDLSGIDFSLFQIPSYTLFIYSQFGGVRNDLGLLSTFENTTFLGHVSFLASLIGSRASFTGANFCGDADFIGTEIGFYTSFKNCTFRSRTSFWRGWLRDVIQKLTSYQRFILSGIRNNSRYPDEYCEYLNYAVNVIAELIKRAQTMDLGSCVDGVDNMEAREATSPLGTRLQKAAWRKDISFEGITVFDEMDFYETKFHGEISFANARFYFPPDFRDCEGLEQLDWLNLRIKLPPRNMEPVGDSKTGMWRARQSMAARMRQLREFARTIGAGDVQRDLFIEERKAEARAFVDDWLKPNKNLPTHRKIKIQLFGWWKPLKWWALLWIYFILANYGRSIVVPLLWIIVLNFGALLIYSELIFRCNILYDLICMTSTQENALLTFTLSNAIPFSGAGTRTLSKAASILFGTPPTIPMLIQIVALIHSVLNTILLFLVALAIRNHFKMT